MFRHFEVLLRPTEVAPDAPPPHIDTPWALIRFYWHFIRQVRPLIALLFCTGLVVALLESA